MSVHGFVILYIGAPLCSCTTLAFLKVSFAFELVDVAQAVSHIERLDLLDLSKTSFSGGAQACNLFLSALLLSYPVSQSSEKSTVQYREHP